MTIPSNQGVVTLAVLPTILHGEIVFFRALHDIDYECVRIPLEALQTVEQVPKLAPDGTPVLAWNARRRRVEHMIAVHDNGGCNFEPWPVTCPWTGVGDELELCLRAVAIFKLDVSGPVVAEA